MYKKDLGIFICNFNKKDYLKGCLQTLFESNFDNYSYDVIIIDNASIDGSPEFIRENYPQIILLENEINTGGSGGFDRGIIYSLEKEYKYTVLLDNDILLEENTILNLMKYIKSNKEVGVVGSKICTMDNPNILQEMGSFIDFVEKFNINTPYKGHEDNGDLPEFVDCDYVPACCLITTNEVLKKVGSFDKRHFIYWDDMDWCTRVKKSGFKVHAISDSRVFHKMGSSDNDNTFGMYYFHRNRIAFFLKYLENEKLDKFIKNISDWLCSLIFFCNLKKDYNTAKVAWFIFDDLERQDLGRQDKRVLKRNIELNLFDEKKQISLIINNNNEKKNIYINYLKKKVESVQIFSSISEVTSELDTIIFKSTENVFNEIKVENMNNKLFFIDPYFNIINNEEIDNLKLFYNKYQEIFFNIFKPIIENKLYKSRLLYKSDKKEGK